MKLKKRIALAILGAGYGRRFGPNEDKLGALLNGKPVAHHVLEAVRPFAWGQKILVCQERSHWAHAYQQENFKITLNENAQGGMLSSLRKAVLSANPDITHLLICLADMPFISSAHLGRLLQAFDGGKAIATQSKNYQGPPAIFALNDLKQLPEVGEGGARSLLQRALFIPCLSQEIKDIDRQEDLRENRTK